MVAKEHVVKSSELCECSQTAIGQNQGSHCDSTRHKYRSSETKERGVAWPSGLRRWFKAPVTKVAWVRIPPLPSPFFFFFHFQLQSFFF